MRQCIYCYTEKLEAEFNQEHALPQAFGSFENHPTLRCVCKACNKQLGDELVSPFMRGSVEGLMRYGVGHKSFTINETPKHLTRRLNFQHFRVIPSLPPELTKMKWEFMGFNEAWQPFIRFPVQIGLWPATMGLPTFFSDIDLQAAPDLSNFVCDNDHPALVYAEGTRNRQLLLEVVQAQNFALVTTRDVAPGPNLEGELKFWLDKTGERLVAYVVFNFLAHEMGADFVLSDDFQAVRAFVRYGHGNGKDFVSMDKRPILWNETRCWQWTRAHQLVLDWDHGTCDIIAKLTLYGTMFYRVLLSRNYRGLFRPDLRRGRAFDWEKHKIFELRAIDGLFLPPS